MQKVKSYLKKIYRVLRDYSPIVIYYRKKYLKKIRSDYDYSNKNITIISSNCIGGLIYHDLGIKFMSPTINLYILQKDFLKFVSNIDYYIEKDLEFINENKEYPIAYLDFGRESEVKIFFLHYKSKEEAEVKWNERKRRINYENIFLIMSDRDGITYDDMIKFGKIPCKRKIIFTYKDYKELPYTFKLDEDKNKQVVGHYQMKRWNGFCEFEMKFNFAKWINGSENFRIENFRKYINK